MLDMGLGADASGYLLRFLDRRDVAWLSTTGRSTQEELREMIHRRNLGLRKDLRIRFRDGFNIAAGYKVLLQREGKYPMIYALGGWDYEVVCCFDPFTQRWISCPEMPTARSNHRAVGVDGRIWAVGGVSYARRGALAMTECFDSRSQRWTSHAPMAQARYNFGLAAISGKLYAVGGDTTQGRIDSMEIFDTATNRWTPGPSLPRARACLTLEVINGKLLAIGGDTVVPEDPDTLIGLSRNPSTTVECFDPKTGKWTPSAPMNVARSGHASTILNGQVVVMGGLCGRNCGTNTVECFDPASNTWSMLPPMNVPRDNFGAATWNDTVIVVGGFSTGQNGEWFRVLPGEEDAGWEPIPDMKNTQLGLCVCAV